MLRFFAGAAACFLLLTGAFLLWQSRAEKVAGLPGAPPARMFNASLVGDQAPLEAPEASPKSREEKRFARYDKNKDGKIEPDEYLGARRKNFDKLDLNHDGKLGFEEYAAKGIEKFQSADHGHKGWLTPADFVATAPPPPNHKTCSCGGAAPVIAAKDSSDDSNDD